MNESTEARVLASQKNGTLGGVKTPEGKAISRQNSIKHGVLANAVNNEYDKVNVNGLFKLLAQEFNVTTVHQNILLEQLVLCYIKLARCSRIESDIMHESMNTQSDLEDILNGKIINQGAKATINEDTVKRLGLVITRYEPQLVNRMLKLMDKLYNYRNHN